MLFISIFYRKNPLYLNPFPSNLGTLTETLCATHFYENLGELG
jgi:hypothetical protein